MTNPFLPGMLPGNAASPADDLTFTSKTQGQESNISGRLCEEAIESCFRRRGILIVDHRSTNGTPDIFEARRLVRNVPYKSLAGCRSRSEFVYEHGPKILVRFECRSQNEPGSVDEKLDWLIDNAADAMPEPYIWIVLNGIGARPKMIQWAKGKIEKLRRVKTIRLYNLAEAQRAIKLLVERGQA
jgi:PD-(D/E)XK nuclease superfamily domain